MSNGERGKREDVLKQKLEGLQAEVRGISEKMVGEPKNGRNWWEAMRLLGIVVGAMAVLITTVMQYLPSSLLDTILLLVIALLVITIAVMPRTGIVADRSNEKRDLWIRWTGQLNRFKQSVEAALQLSMKASPILAKIDAETALDNASGYTDLLRQLYFVAISMGMKDLAEEIWNKGQLDYDIIEDVVKKHVSDDLLKLNQLIRNEDSDHKSRSKTKSKSNDST